MTPKLINMDRQPAQLMDRGMFDFMHAWDIGEGYALEYWRGTDNNGACLRTLSDGRLVSVTHYAAPGAAINVLRLGGYPVPGVPAIADMAERERALSANLRHLRANHVTCIRA